MPEQKFEIHILPDPSNYRSLEDEGWQEKCEQLYLELKETQLSIKPMKKKGSENTRGADLYYILTAGIASIGGFNSLYKILKLWVDNKNQNRERVTVKIKCGEKEINILYTSIETALELWDKFKTEG